MREASRFDGVVWDHAMASPLHEIVTLKYLARIACPACSFVDVGAYVGYFSVRLAKHYKQITAIEPNPHNREALSKNLELNGISNVKILSVACDNQKGIRTLYHKGPGSRTYITEEQLEEIQVETDLLDSLVEDPMAVKIDTEGSEANVLEGSKRLISQGPVWIIEDHREVYGKALRPDYWSRILFLLQGYRPSRIEVNKWIFKPKR